MLCKRDNDVIMKCW